MELNKEDEEKLVTLGRKTFKKNFGSVRENGIWRIRYNLDLQSKYREPNIIKVKKAFQIRWLGHVFRYSDGNSIKKITFHTPEGKMTEVGGRRKTENKVDG
ncbi:hypothetical protein TNCV_5101261 [Trichonephila clavipes]|nr:hypothetical protein TNCV_5101261 [Trichonephila clavipes]